MEIFQIIAIITSIYNRCRMARSIDHGLFAKCRSHIFIENRNILLTVNVSINWGECPYSKVGNTGRKHSQEIYVSVFIWDNTNSQGGAVHPSSSIHKCCCQHQPQQIPILYFLVWPDRDSNPRSTALDIRSNIKYSGNCLNSSWFWHGV